MANFNCNNISQNEAIDITNKTLTGQDNETVAASVAIFQEVINYGKCLSIICPDIAQCVLDKVFLPEVNKRGITQSQIETYRSEAKQEVASGLAESAKAKAALSAAEYIKIRDTRLKNNKIWMWVIIIVVVLVAAWAWMKYRN